MLTKTEALELVSKELQQRHSPDNRTVVVDKDTIERAFGWVFFYNTKRFLETGKSRYRLLGNGPVIVNKHTANIEFFGSGKPVEEVISDYERNLAVRPSHSTVEELLSQLDSITLQSSPAFELWVPEHLTLRGQPARSDVAMAIVLDKILSKGYRPDGFDEGLGGKAYKYKVSR